MNLYSFFNEADAGPAVREMMRGTTARSINFKRGILQMKGKSRAIALVLFLFTAMVTDSNAYEINDYMPLQVGNTWLYTGDYQISITGTEVVNGTTTFIFANSLTGYGLFAIDADGLTLYAGDGVYITPPLTLIGSTFDVGNVFTATGVLGSGESITVTHDIIGFEQLSVPAYSGESLKVGVSVVLGNGADYTEEIWVAEGIGLVKMINHNSEDEGFLWGLDNELLSYHVTSTPIPGAVWLLGPGLCLALLV
jgi:hypothetical protein